MVACALTRQVARGKVAGRNTVKPRLALTTDQSLMVVGVPGAVVTVAVAVGELPGVPVLVATGVTVTVGVRVTVGVAPSSRNNIAGLPHQLNFARDKLAGCVVAVVG